MGRILIGQPVGIVHRRRRVELNAAQIHAIPLAERTMIRSLAEKAGMAKTTIHRRFKEGLLKRHSNAIKPTLTESNKRARLEFCISNINPHTFLDNPTFQGKWMVDPDLQEFSHWWNGILTTQDNILI